MTSATTSTGPDLGEGGLIRNPVLPGFHPDPSIVRVGADYYIATSTFEWYPGVRLHRSTDLVRWRPLGGVLTERRLLDLTGAGDSAGRGATGSPESRSSRTTGRRASWSARNDRSSRGRRPA